MAVKLDRVKVHSSRQYGSTAKVSPVPNPVIRAKATAAFIRLKVRCESRRPTAMSTGTLAGA